MPTVEEPKPSVWVVGACALAGLLVGAISQGHGGRLLLGTLLGAAVGELIRLHLRVRALESRLREQPQRASAVVTSVFESPRQMAPAPEAKIHAAAPAAPPPPPSLHRVTSASTRDELPRAPPPIRSNWSDNAFARWLQRGNPIARAGVVILFFGGSFLAKYAAEHSMFPLELRLAALAAGALALLGIGWRLRKTRPLYAQTLQGGGVAGFYLTVFAATRLYHLLPHGLALGLMIVVALAAAVLAVAQDALALAVIGTSGGFLAPILLSACGGSLAALFTYYTVLNLGVFAVAWFRTWRVLNLLGLVFTFGVAGLFRAVAFAPDQRWVMDFFLLLFFGMYAAVTVLASVRQKPNLKAYLSGSMVFGLPLVAFGLHGSVVRDIPYALAWSALGLGTFYLLLAAMLHRSRRENLSPLAQAFAALGVVFASLAVPLAVDARTTSALWAVEGAGMVWIGCRQQRRLARAFGLLLQLGGAARFWGALIVTDTTAQSAPPVLNSSYIGALMLSIAGMLSGWWLYGNRARQAPYERQIDTGVALWGLGWWVGGGLNEIHRFAAGEGLGIALAFTAASASALFEFGRRGSWPLARRAAAALLPLAAIAGLERAVSLEHAFAQAGWIGWPLLLAGLLGLLWRCDDGEADALMNKALPWLHAGGFWLLALLAAWEIDWQVRQLTGGVWHWLSWGLVAASGLWWLHHRPLWPRWPLERHASAYRLSGAIPMALAGAMWAVLINLGSDGDPAGLPYIPLLNPLDLAVGLLLAAFAAYWLALTAEERRQVSLNEPRAIPMAAAALAFLWLNAALLRALHFVAGAPLDAAGILHSILAQAALSIFWGALGFTTMTLAARRGSREAWIAGAVLMVLVVAKLFVVDTAGSGTVARIASFLTVGALLLLTGYLSPLPPRKDADTGATH